MSAVIFVETAMPSVTREGAEIRYECRGTGPVVVFVQGVGVAGCGWSPQVEELSRDHLCITVDNRGIGESTRGSGTLDVDTMARDVLAVVASLGLSRAHFVGHSLGGVIVQRLALLDPARVTSLSLLCTFAGGRDLERPSRRLVWLGMRSRVGTRAMRRRAFAGLVSPDSYVRERGESAVIDELEAAFGRSLADTPGIADEQLDALRRHDERERLAELAEIPALVVSAEHDPIARADAGRALAEGIGRARYVAWADASHALPIQQRSEVNAMLRAHFASAAR